MKTLYGVTKIYVRVLIITINQFELFIIADKITEHIEVGAYKASDENHGNLNNTLTNSI